MNQNIYTIIEREWSKEIKEKLESKVDTKRYSDSPQVQKFYSKYTLEWKRKYGYDDGKKKT